jgi:hypothetical protein
MHHAFHRIAVGIAAGHELVMAMIWTSTNLVIQIFAGVLGAHFAATAAREHGFGFLGHPLQPTLGVMGPCVRRDDLRGGL